MYTRIIDPPERENFFLFGPRGTGKSTWVRSAFPEAVYVDLLDSRLYTSLLASPHLLPEHQVRDKFLGSVAKILPAFWGIDSV